LVHEVEIGEAVHIDLGLEYYYHTITSQLDGLDFTTETQLTYATIGVIIPDHHLLSRRLITPSKPKPLCQSIDEDGGKGAMGE